VVRSEILPANPDVLEGADDLNKLCYLNEPSVLHNLKLRYSQGMIYVCMPALAFSFEYCYILLQYFHNNPNI